MGSDFQKWLTVNKELINNSLSAKLDFLEKNSRSEVKKLSLAMRYSLESGGKRLRALLALAAAQSCGQEIQLALPFSLAVELVHTYSLIHDDLPAMDDDKLRRGKATCHLAFDEATAILAGDALLSLAFEILAAKDLAETENQLKAIRILASASGVFGMIGGQMMDLTFEGQNPNIKQVEKMASLKTAALITASLVGGATLAGANKKCLDQLEKIGSLAGLAFQIQDDILDATGQTDTLGKITGRDETKKKASYLRCFGLEESRKTLHLLKSEALKLSNDFAPKSPLVSLITMMVERKS